MLIANYSRIAAQFQRLSILLRASWCLLGILLVLCANTPLEGASVGQTVTLTANAAGTKPFRFQWYKNGQLISGATAGKLTLSQLKTTDRGEYAVQITNLAGSATANPVYVSVSDPVVLPVIVGQPKAHRLAEGQSVTLSVSAIGTGPMQYQWVKNGVTIGGATKSSITLSNTTASTTGDYTVKITNVKGTVQSAVARVEVLPWQTLPGGAGGAAVSTATALFQSALESFQLLSGDFDIRLQVSAVSATNGRGEAGIFIQSSASPTEVVYKLTKAQNGDVLFSTLSNQMTVGKLGGALATKSTWLRLTRINALLYAYHSLDGGKWDLLAKSTVTLPSTVRSGKFKTSNQNGVAVTATFKSIAIKSLPSGWKTADVGSAAVVGFSYAEAGDWTLSGAGSGLRAKSDQFHFVYQQGYRNCEMVTRVPTMTNPSASALAGLMIRESLSPNSPFVFVGRNPFGQSGVISRNVAGALPAVNMNFLSSAPWVKIQRVDDVINTFFAIDGVNWVKINSTTIPMGYSSYIGFVVASNTTSSAVQAQFQFVELRL